MECHFVVEIAIELPPPEERPQSQQVTDTRVPEPRFWAEWTLVSVTWFYAGCMMREIAADMRVQRSASSSNCRRPAAVSR